MWWSGKEENIALRGKERSGIWCVLHPAPGGRGATNSPCDGQHTGPRTIPKMIRSGPDGR